MALKQKVGEAPPDLKKRRRVGFANIDSGVEANECIKVFLVKGSDEVGSANSICSDLVDLNHFVGDDGKIYGYKDLKINIWLSIMSFHAYAEISFESTSDGGKGITNLTPILQSIFGESLLDKEEFLQTFSKECDFVSEIISIATAVQYDSLEDDLAHLDDDGSTVEVIHIGLENPAAGLLYSRLVPLLLLLVEGSTPIDVTDPRWNMFVVVKKKQCPTSSFIQFLGFATVYCFYHYPEGSRMRISQILVLPPYQCLGHGRRLLQAINSFAISKNMYDVTVEDASEYLQYLRACVESIRLLAFEPIKPAIGTVVSCLAKGNLSKRRHKLSVGPSAALAELVRQQLKISKKQFLRCWEVLVYQHLEPEDHLSMDNFRACISERVKGDVVDNDSACNGKRVINVPNEYDPEMTFVMFWSPVGGRMADGVDGKVGGAGAPQEEQLKQLVDKELEDISEIAKRVSLLCKGGC